MKFVRPVLALSLLTLPLLAASRFGNYTGVVAQVPFEFVVGNRIVPPGECIVQSNSAAGATILVRNPNAGVDVFSVASTVDTGKPAGDSALIFHKYGNQYFLAAIRLRGMQSVYEVPKSKAENELRSHHVPSAERVVLPL